MRSILLRIILFIIILHPIAGRAQIFEAALGAGFDSHNVVTDHHVIGNRGGGSATATAGIIVFPTYTAGLMYMQNKFGYTTLYGNVDLATPARNYSVYISKHIKLPNYTYHLWHSFFTVRAYAGLTYIEKGSPYIDPLRMVNHNNFKGNGRNMGCQVEYSHPVFKFISIFGNVGIGGAFIEGYDTYQYLTDPTTGAPLKKKVRFNVMYYNAEIGAAILI